MVAMPLSLTIRTFSPRKTMHRILAEVHMDARAKSDASGSLSVHDLPETRLWMAKTVLPRQRVRAATVGDTMVGLSAFADDMLEQLYVRPGFQGQGVADRCCSPRCARRHARRFGFGSTSGMRQREVFMSAEVAVYLG